MAPGQACQLSNSSAGATIATEQPARGALIDLDGTLVDSVCHHLLAWSQALRYFDVEVPRVRIHAGIGLGSDRSLP